MATTHPALRHVRRWLERAGPAAGNDAELVRRFAKQGDQAAFAELVDRHGPMVLAVARRVVADYQAAEDVFQATFLALARRAGRIRRPEALPGWLHRTAYHIGLNAVRARARRQRAEAARHAPPSASAPDLDARELLAILDQELARLPESLRVPLVLCCLEGLTQDEAATRLGWSPGSVRGRLERGRRLLRDRLARRGLTFAVGAGTTLLLDPVATVAGPLRDAAVRAAAGQGVRPAVAALAARFSGSGPRAAVLSVVAVAGLLAAGTVALSGWQHADPPPTPDKPPPGTASRADRLPDGAVARLGWSPHRVGNSAFALTPDEKEIVTVSPEGIVRRFDAKTGRLTDLRQFADRGDVSPAGYESAALSADGTIAVASERLALGHRFSVWDVRSGKVLFRWALEKQERVGEFALSPDGRVLAINEYVRQGAILRAYDVSTGRGRVIGQLEMNVNHMHFSADSRRLFVSQTSGRRDDGPGKFIACFDVAAGKEVWKLPADCDKFAVSSDGRTVIFAQYDRPGYRLIETDLKTGETTQTEQPHAPAHPNVPVAFAPDDRTLLAAEFNDLIAWDIRAGKTVSRIKLPQAELVGFGPELGAFSADGKTGITKRGALARWDLTTGKPVFEAVAGDGLGAFVEHLAFTPDGKALYAAGYVHNAAVWDLATGKRTSYHRNGIGKHLVTTPAGLRTVGVDDRSPHELVVYDPVSGTPTKSVRWAEEKKTGADRLGAYTLAADGRTVLLLQNAERGGKGNPIASVIAYDTATDRQLTRVELPAVSYYGRPPFSPCGRWLALAGKVYHVRTGTELFAPADGDGDRLVAGTPFSLRGAGWFSPDGRLLAGRLEKTEGFPGDKLVVWELASGRVLARLPNAGLVTQVVFGPDGRTIALADGRGARVYDVLTERRLAEFIAPDITGGTFENDPQTIAFSPDGRRLATGHCDGSVLIWAVPRPPAANVGDLWAALADPSPAVGRAAVSRSVGDPAAFKVLQERFRPPPEEPDPPVAARIDDLDSDSYATREAASKKLRELGAKAEPALRRALTAARSAEARRRLEDILAAVAPAVETLPVPAETLRGVRAIEVLERVGTPEARELLQAWADQGRDPRLAAEARSVLGRVGAARK